ncbi:hypothetical protein QTG54_009976 [Skeletonema marinoi]|uniref:Uncharacterized protein n=1 Tax=Skeletonema marinoi TaxID=267567 RepID=A0AAD8Y4J3_9STRA|nr:hypothetical protein QTG54_009976 [Skeletonema marinoi]
MSGWDDEDDLDLMLLDDVEDTAPLNNGDTTTIDDSNNNGWEDDDGLDALDDFSSQEEEQEIEPPAVAAATPLTRPSTAGTETTVVKMLNEHEKMMHNEIKQIQTADENVAATNIEEQVAASADDNDDEDDDAWDFEDDEDIFNEDNDDLNFIDETTTMTSAPTETIAASLPTTTTIDAAAQFSSSITSDGTNPNSNHQQSNPPPPPPPTENNKVSIPETNKNPFLQDSDDEGQPPSPFEEQHDTAVLNNENEEMDNAIISDNEDGWSDDDDLFEEGDELLDSSSPVQKTTPSAGAAAGVVAATAVPPPPPPVPIAASTSAASHISPVANRTRSKNATPGPPPPPIPKPLQHQQHQPPLNPSQQRIHQMLTTYTANLKSNNYPSRLHSKLHMYQTKPRTTSQEENTITPAAELRHYYAIRPKLRKYTLGVELDRMEYTLRLENGSRTSDKDVIRSYFGVGEDGGMVGGGGDDDGEVEATVEELLIRSANQSLLADALVALTGSEEDVLVDDTSCEDDDFFDGDDDGAKSRRSMGLILSGPLCMMSSVAETCQFTVDLQCGKVEALCDLAISVPFHGDVTAIQELLEYDEQLGEKIIGDGRIILARARVSVRFRPGGEGGNENDEPTVQYAIQSINALLSPNSPVLRQVAIALAHDQEDPFFQEEQRADVGDATDIRDLFLLNQHLLSDSGLLAVSDQLERLRGAAEAKSTGFRSALRQLDGVTNVSGKLQFLKGTANATRGQGSGSGTSGFLGLGLALPSAEEIEAAEREAQNAVTRQDDATFHFPRPDEVHEGLRFPRPYDGNEGYSRPFDDRNARPHPPPPPPPPPAPPGRPPQTEEVIDRPKPIIGGLFTGLSRLAAAATQSSDLRTEQQWGDEGGTGLTPPSSPKANHFVQAPTTDFPTVYRKEENANIISQSTTGLEDGVIGIVQHPLTHLASQQPCDQGSEFLTKGDVNGETIMENTVEDEHEEDGGWWSDDEFDFEEPASKDFVEDQSVANKKESKGTPLPPSSTSHAEEEEVVSYLQQNVRPFESKTDTQQSIQSKPSKRFSEEVSIALQGKIESENKEMIQSGRLKRWTPLREDRILRQKLMEVMRHNLIQN